MAISSKTKSAVRRATRSTRGKSVSEQVSAITGALRSSGVSRLSGGGGGSSSSGGQSSDFGVFGNAENLAGFINSVKGLDSSNTSGINRSISAFGGSPSNYIGADFFNNIKQNPIIGAKELGTPISDITIPPAPTVPNYSEVQDALNPMNIQGQQAEMTTEQKLLESYGVVPPKPESIADDRGYQQKERDVQRARSEMNNYQAQISAIVNKSQADQLRVTGQGRGIPEAIIGGQQAQIAKEAAIQALPIQAQLAAAQGNLELAQSNLDTYFKIKSQDIQNNYTYQQSLFSAIKDFVDKKDQRLYEEKVRQSEFTQKKDLMALQFDYNKRLKSVGLGGGGGLSSTSQAVINNPNLLNSLTPTLKGQVITELAAAGYDTTSLGTKPLSDTAITTIAQSEKALADLSDLKALVEDNVDKIGPLTGLQAINPWSSARKLQADVDRVRQTVGKALEGGVLRKEDEEKYKKILATLTDTPETAVYKINALISSLERDVENYKSLQQSAGRTADVSASLKKIGEVTNQEDLRAKYNY